MSNLFPPPERETNHSSQSWIKWRSAIYSLVSSISTGGLIAWSAISKTGSNLTELDTRNHSDLQNINTASYTHLTDTQAEDLTDAGDSALHYHASDRTYADNAVTTHVGLADPHTQYALETDVTIVKSDLMAFAAAQG